MNGFVEVGGRVPRPLQNTVFGKGVEHGEACSTSERMAGVGITMKQLRSVRAAHEGVVYLLLHEHRAHRNGAVGDALRRRHDVWNDPQKIARERLSQAPEAGDNLIEDQQNSVTRADI